MIQLLKHPLLLASIVFISCNTHNTPANDSAKKNGETSLHQEDTLSKNTSGTLTTAVVQNTLCIFQDSKDHFWFGTQNSGVYRYDGEQLVQFTDKDGLSNNQVQTIQEDASGHTWFGTSGFGISRYDGTTMTTFTNLENLPIQNHSNKINTAKPDDLWFFAGDGMYCYRDNTMTHFPLMERSLDPTNPQSPSNQLSSYAIYCSLKDTKGNLWFGTQSMGVCRYDPSQADGKSFTWLTESGLAGPAVLALFEDTSGILWFGNNGNGLFRYDPTSGILSNFTKEKGLSNDEFRKSGKAGPGTLARIYSINEDNSGNLWIGTVDAGVWRYDGKTLKNYTTKDGLTNNAVTTIFKDKKGELWFGTETEVCRFNGTSFTAFSFH